MIHEPSSSVLFSYAIFSILGGLRASIRSSAHPDFTLSVQVSLNFAQDRAFYILYNSNIYHLHTTIKNLVTYILFMTPSLTHQAPFLWKKDKAMGSPLIHYPSAPNKAILNYSQQTKTTYAYSFICCSIRFVSLSLPIHMVSKHTMVLKTAVDSVQIRGVADSYTPIHTYTYALTDKHTVTC